MADHEIEALKSKNEELQKNYLMLKRLATAG